MELEIRMMETKILHITSIKKKLSNMYFFCKMAKHWLTSLAVGSTVWNRCRCRCPAFR